MKLSISLEEAACLEWALRVTADCHEVLAAEGEGTEALLDLAKKVAEQMWQQRAEAKTEDEKTILLGLELIRTHPALADPT
jgi:hypothetical protein